MSMSRFSIIIRRPRRVVCFLLLLGCAFFLCTKYARVDESTRVVVRQLLATDGAIGVAIEIAHENTAPKIEETKHTYEGHVDDFLRRLREECAGQSQLMPGAHKYGDGRVLDGATNVVTTPHGENGEHGIRGVSPPSKTDNTTRQETSDSVHVTETQRTQLVRRRRDMGIAGNTPAPQPMRRVFNDDRLPQDENEIVDVMICSDFKTVHGMVAAVSSVIANTKAHPFFRLVVTPNIAEMVTRWILHYYPNVTMEVIPFRGELLREKIIVRGRRKELGSPMNFARFFLPILFPTLTRRVVFIDDDTIVRGDIRELRDIHIPKGKVAAFSTDNVNRLSMFLNFGHPLIQKLKMNPKKHAFNAGVFVADTAAWRKHKITEKLVEWMDLNTHTNVYGGEAGGGVSQPPMLIALHNRTVELPAEWHVRHFGWQVSDNYTLEYVANAKLLHWNGKAKPWNTRGKWMGLWYEYYRQEPTAHMMGYMDPILSKKGRAYARAMRNSLDQLNNPVKVNGDGSLVDEAVERAEGGDIQSPIDSKGGVQTEPTMGAA